MQALQVTEKDGRFQVVMDVRDFDPRNLQVRAVEDTRIVVEGKYQQREGGSSSWKTFSKEFTLPEEADIDQVTTALSKDGVLTVRAPRKDKSSVSAVESRKPKSNVLQSVDESYDEQRTADGVSTKSHKSTSSSTSSSSKTSGCVKGLHSSSSFESCDSGLDSLPRNIRDRLMVDESSGLSSMSSNNSSCSSPVPSEAASDISRVSTSMQFDIGSGGHDNANNAANNTQRSEVTFNVIAPEKNENLQQRRSPSSTSDVSKEKVMNSDSESVISNSSRSSSDSKKEISSSSNSYLAPNVRKLYMPSAGKMPIFTAGCGSSGDTMVTVEEKDGRRVKTSERSNVIQEKDGILESREIASETDEKDGQSARREALTKIQRRHDDVDGRYKGAEKAEASDVSESSIKVLPDGTKMNVKKSSTSSSSKKSFSTSGGAMDAFDDPFFNIGFGSEFGDVRSLMGRGHSLMSQMSTDSMASTLSGRSGLSDLSHMSDQSRASNRSTMSGRSGLSDSSQMSDHSRASSRMSDTSNYSEKSHQSDKNNNSNESRNLRSTDSNMRDRFGFSSDHLSMFPERSSLFENRPSLAERFPSFSDQMSDFGDFHDMNFPSTDSAFSRPSRNSNSSFSSSSNFGSSFNDRF